MKTPPYVMEYILEITDESYASAEDKHPVEWARLDVGLCLVLREASTEIDSTLEVLFFHVDGQESYYLEITSFL